MVIQRIIILLIIITSSSCVREHKSIEPQNVRFKIPTIVQEKTQDTICFFKEDCLKEVWPIFYIKSKFKDTLFIIDKTRKDTTFNKDFLSNRSDTFPYDGFQIIPDYKTNIYFKRQDSYINGNLYYPVYLVNETSEAKYFPAMPNHVYSIQEAYDTTYNRWKPIEASGFDFCGVGSFVLKVNPSEFAMFLIPKYEGNLETRIRIRTRVNEIVYISKPFFGKINYQQFIIKNGTWPHSLLSDKYEKASSIQWYFLGSFPNAYNE